MNRFTSHSDGIDYSVQTAATLASCIQNRQWQHVARIGGFKSEHDARVAHDIRYAIAFAVEKQDAPVKASVSFPHRAARRAPGSGYRSSNANEPWVQAFLQAAKSRMSILGIERKHVADHLGIARSTFGSCFARTGYLSIQMMGRIDAALTEMEAMRAAA